MQNIDSWLDVYVVHFILIWPEWKTLKMDKYFLSCTFTYKLYKSWYWQHYRCMVYLVPVVESLRVQQQRQAIVLPHLQQGKWNNSSLQLCIQSFCLAFCPLQDLHTNIVGFETSHTTVVPEIIKKDSGLQINACCISLFVRYISASF